MKQRREKNVKKLKQKVSKHKILDAKDGQQKYGEYEDKENHKVKKKQDIK